jgi:hypothetical protein
MFFLDSLHAKLQQPHAPLGVEHLWEPISTEMSPSCTTCATITQFRDEKRPVDWYNNISTVGSEPDLRARDQVGASGPQQSINRIHRFYGDIYFFKMTKS